jgi:hypothetical protein
VHDVQHKRPTPPRFEELSRQVPQAEGAIEQDDQGFAVLGVPALRIGFDALHHRLLRPHQAGETPDLLSSGRLVPRVFSLPACMRRFRINQEFRQRFRRPRLGIDRVANSHQRFLLLLSLLSGAQLGGELNRLLLDHRDALAIKAHHQEFTRKFLRGHRPLRIEAFIVLRRLLGDFHQDALGDIEIEELGEEARTFLEGMLDLEDPHPLLQEVRVAPLGQVDLRVQRENPRFPGRAIAGPGYCDWAEERAVLAPPELLLPGQEHAVGPRDGRSHIPRSALGEVQLHRRQPNGQQALEDAFLRFVRLELPGMFPGKLDQRLECLLSFRDTHLDIEHFHGDPPDVVNHKNTGQMFSGFYHGRRIPCTRKISARATLSLNAFCVRSR